MVEVEVRGSNFFGQRMMIGMISNQGSLFAVRVSHLQPSISPRTTHQLDIKPQLRQPLHPDGTRWCKSRRVPVSWRDINKDPW
jgi:hypothetical protein